MLRWSASDTSTDETKHCFITSFIAKTFTCLVSFRKEKAMDEKRIKAISRIVNACGKLDDEALMIIASNAEGIELGYKLAMKKQEKES